MIFHAVHGRCAVDLRSLNPGASREEMLLLLGDKGFLAINVDMLALARSCIGRSTYRRCALMREAPLVVDCASLIKWLYGQRGIWLPRDLILWPELCTPIQVDGLSKGDLIFTDGYTNRTVEKVGNIGHVGMVTDCRTIIHATNRVGVEEVPFDLFFLKRKICCARRVAPKGADIVTLSVPPDQEIEISNDIEWILFGSMNPPDRINQSRR